MAVKVKTKDTIKIAIYLELNEEIVKKMDEMAEYHHIKRIELVRRVIIAEWDKYCNERGE